MKKIATPFKRVFNWGAFSYERPITKSGKVAKYFQMLRYICEQERPVTHRELVAEVLKVSQYRKGLWISGLTGMVNAGLLTSSRHGYEMTDLGRNYVDEVLEIYYEIVSNL